MSTKRQMRLRAGASTSFLADNGNDLVVADYTRGEEERRVVVELTPQLARSLAADLHAWLDRRTAELDSARRALRGAP